MTSHGDAELVLRRRPFGSWLLGSEDQSTRMLRIRLRILLTTFAIGTNLIGAAVVFALAVFVLPGPPLTDQLLGFEAIFVPSYLLFAIVVGSVWCTRATVRRTAWVDEDRPATRKEQIVTLRLPLRLTLIQMLLWIGGGDRVHHGHGGAAAGERAADRGHDLRRHDRDLRGLLPADRVHASGRSPRGRWPTPRRRADCLPSASKRARWSSGRPAPATPVTGLMLAAVLALIDGDVSATRLAVMILALGMVVLIVGGLLILLSARSVVAPVRSVRDALTLIGEGELEHPDPGLRRDRARLAAGRVQPDGGRSAGA